MKRALRRRACVLGISLSLLMVMVGCHTAGPPAVPAGSSLVVAVTMGAAWRFGHSFQQRFRRFRADARHDRGTNRVWGRKV